MKKVLMISYAFPPMSVVGVYRTLKFCKFLPEFGWEPVVLTVRRGEDWAYDESLSSDLPPETKVYRTISFEPLSTYESLQRRMRKPPLHTGETPRVTVSTEVRKSLPQRVRSYLAGWLQTPDKQTFWFPFALARGRGVIRDEEIDLIYTSSPPHSTHLIGRGLSKLCDLPWVADFRDPWTLNEYFHEKPTTPRMKEVESYLEKLVVNRCDHLIANTDSVLQSFKWKYNHLPKNKFSAIPNGYDPDDFAGLQPYDWDKFTVVHLGSFYGRRHPVDFLEGLKLFLQRYPAARERLRVLFIGNIETEILSQVQAFNLSEVVECRPHQPHREALRLALSSHLLLLILGHDHRSAGILPAKLFEYLYTNKPILALISEGEVATVIRSLRAGAAITSPDTAEIASAIERYYDGYLRGTPTLDHARSAGIEGYHRYHLTEKLADIFDSLICQQPLEGAPRRRSLEVTYGVA